MSPTFSIRGLPITPPFLGGPSLLGSFSRAKLSTLALLSTPSAADNSFSCFSNSASGVVLSPNTLMCTSLPRGLGSSLLAAAPIPIPNTPTAPALIRLLIPAPRKPPGVPMLFLGFTTAGLLPPSGDALRPLLELLVLRRNSFSSLDRRWVGQFMRKLWMFARLGMNRSENLSEAGDFRDERELELHCE